MFFILRSKIKLMIISFNHTTNQVPQSRTGLIARGSCPLSWLGHTSDIHSHSYNRFMSAAPTQQQTSLTSSAGPVYNFSFYFL